MREQFDISGVFETTEFEIANVACTLKILMALPGEFKLVWQGYDNK